MNFLDTTSVQIKRIEHECNSRLRTLWRKLQESEVTEGLYTFFGQQLLRLERELMDLGSDSYALRDSSFIYERMQEITWILKEAERSLRQHIILRQDRSWPVHTSESKRASQQKRISDTPTSSRAVNQSMLPWGYSAAVQNYLRYRPERRAEFGTPQAAFFM